MASTEVTAEKLDATRRESVGLPPVSTSRDDAADEVDTSWACSPTPTTGSAVAVRDPRDHVHQKSSWAKAGPEAAGSARVEVQVDALLVPCLARNGGQDRRYVDHCERQA